MSSEPPKKKKKRLDRRSVRSPPPSQPPQPPPAVMNTPYTDLGIESDAGAADIRQAHGSKSLRLYIDPDDPPDSPAHMELRYLGDARDILYDESMRIALDLCLGRANGERNDRPWEDLGILENATDDEVTNAYERQMSRWNGYERYSALIETVMNHAYERMFERNAILPQASKESIVVKNETEDATVAVKDGTKGPSVVKDGIKHSSVDKDKTRDSGIDDDKFSARPWPCFE